MDCMKKKYSDLDRKINDLERCVLIVKNEDAITHDLNRHRMTYEQAGHIFDAMKKAAKGSGEALEIAYLQGLTLTLPDTPNPTFADFLDYNALRLQCFDMPKQFAVIKRAGESGYYYKELS